MNKKLIFAYNAESGLLNGAIDSLHKLTNPETYQCDLCQLTYGLAGEKKEWREFLDEIDIETEFYHKDEVDEMPVAAPKLPAVLLIDENGAVEWSLMMDGWDDIEDLDDLIEAIEDAIDESE